MVNLAGIKAVALDCYGTLIDFDDDRFKGIFHTIAEDQGLPIDGKTLWDTWLTEGEALAKASGADWRQVDGPLPPFEPYRLRWPAHFEAAFRKLGHEGDGSRAYRRLYQCMVEGEAYPDVRPALDALHAGHIPVAVLSNADDDFLRDVLDRNGLRFDIIESSEAAQSYKPHRSIFEHMAKRLGVGVGEVLYVGDSAVADVTGAKNAGMPVAWINRNAASLPEGTPAPDFEIRSLLELPPLLYGTAVASR